VATHSNQKVIKGYTGIIATDFRENLLYLIKYLDIFIWVKNASGKCSEVSQKPQNRPQIDFQGRVFHEI
jgi:hypothetical protein